MPHEKFLQLSHDCKAFTEKSLDFQRKIVERSGLGDETYLPDGGRPQQPDFRVSGETKNKSTLNRTYLSHFWCLACFTFSSSRCIAQQRQAAWRKTSTLAAVWAVRVGKGR
jgi:hypothetical protein